MEKRWHYGHLGEMFGPVTDAELKAAADREELLPGDLVWKEGMPKWRPAREVKGLFPSPPPLPISEENDEADESLAHRRQSEKRKKPLIKRMSPVKSDKIDWWYVGKIAGITVSAGVGLVIFCVIFYVWNNQPYDSGRSIDSLQSEFRGVPMDRIERELGSPDRLTWNELGHITSLEYGNNMKITNASGKRIRVVFRGLGGRCFSVDATN